MSTAISPRDARWLDAAVRIAMPYLGTTAENPTVGAIVVSPGGVVVGRGVTAWGGRPHAETEAIAMAGEGAQGATLYVTLEPCNHWGRTPPCVDAVIEARIARVVIGAADPDPRTGGASIAKLRENGVDVHVARDHAGTTHLHEGFFSRTTRGRPFLTAKLAVSADGRIGATDRGNVPVTGEVARRWTHVQRAFSDAVMVGAGTARIDDPNLTVRLPGLENRKPFRVVVGSGKPLDPKLNLFVTAAIYPTAVIAENRALESLPEAVQRVPVALKNGKPDLKTGLEALAGTGIGTVLCEGGAVLNDALLDAGLIDRFHLLESDVELGADGVPATVHPSLPERLTQLGYREVDRRALGCDRLRTFEPS
ncbi:bifunctional diaminohydroxyphosphoribosylaminopyrimidine deaminase/5-amino-6-(5-phosphoribosylamino)uracil reductase RibD [Pelagibacterium xiamenense]|uniref:bifunctional diaminohydroxyphosphoribosylaminopyrimidine deaminase/5-amino-6-(5-phosphoribosylamino)uracil reductase RibD n=1 Tax=Pelagibacterium xiamenense TaxID=2901140 RepID=UPI001E4C382E|nr:bifunctional diaminohydroxyphosphoribosylaminopyrimidine deaminase/5-amino-6-(5-phosphoribosylamino)uracil reductase RibD [Pelagibacterium xiamenense]